MYRCEISGELIPAGTRSRKVVLQVRPVNYLQRPDALKKKKKSARRRNSGDPGGNGWEIVKEVFVCQRVWEQYQDVAPEVLPQKIKKPSRLQLIEDQTTV
ncbi:MAG: hypothetical protein JKY65_22600 [Planctomycetes bacterium]|nr:hypothetical protein [Planctomycetota bacterium]